MHGGRCQRRRRGHDRRDRRRGERGARGVCGSRRGSSRSAAPAASRRSTWRRRGRCARPTIWAHDRQRPLSRRPLPGRPSVAGRRDQRRRRRRSVPSANPIVLEHGADPRDVALVDDHTAVVSQYGAAELLDVDLDHANDHADRPQRARRRRRPARSAAGSRPAAGACSPSCGASITTPTCRRRSGRRWR